MIYLCDDVTKYKEFFTLFQELHTDLKCIDLSKLPSSTLATESTSIVDHHKSCCVFLGYIEPGWMLDPSTQVQLRKLFRKFPVGIISQFSESLPLSWKNEINTLYTFKSLQTYGDSVTVNNGSLVQDKFGI
jgi:hypothetical protein